MTEPPIVYRALPRWTVPVIILLVVLAVTQCACGIQATLPVSPTYQAPRIGQTDIPKSMVSANAEKVNSDAHNYITTAPLHVRSCASVECDIHTTLPAETSVIVTVRGITGGGCAGAEWWAVESGGFAGFVCNIYLEEK